MIHTNDLIIRSALMKSLNKTHIKDKKVRIIEELGVKHGESRVDVAVVNGIIHGYEIKSDKDTLQRLPKQMSIFNSIFNKVSLVVGKSHLYDAINILPDWWGVIVAKINTKGCVDFNLIREAEENRERDSISLARLLWKNEALELLEEKNKAKGFYSKSRDSIYKKLSTIFDQKTLERKVREAIFFRENWRPDAPLMRCDD